MTSKPLPEDFHWVIARSKCSIATMFMELELGVIDDTEKAQSLVPPQEWTKFSVTKTIGTRFAAARVDDPVTCRATRVHFSYANNEIQVHDNDGKLLLKATLTLTNDGECKLKVGEQELDQWQFRRMALESLFFPAR
jgi:hypothetical protein